MPTAFDDLLTDTPPQAAAEDFSDLLTDEPPAPPQSPLETGVRAAAQAPGQSVMSAYSGVGRAAENFGDTLGQTLPGPLGPIAKGYFKAITAVPRYLGPIAKDIANESQRVYNPDSQRNPKSAAVGSGIGQALPMAGTALIAGPAGPLALAAGQGMDQGIDQAEEMGITDPAKKLAMGTAYGGVELLTEKLGGFGSKAFTAPVKRTLGQMFKEGVKTVASEAIEEPIAGIAQDAIATGFAPPSYDTKDLRPFVMSPSGVPVPNPSYIDRRGLETLGGAAGGVAGAGVQMLANRSTPAAPEAPTVEGDPLAAFAATMPETVQGSPFPVPGSTDVGPEAWAEMLTNEGPPLEGQPIDWTDLVTDAPPSVESRQPGTGNPEPGTLDASVTPPASPVPTPAAAAEAPVVPTTDAGSTPAAGPSLPGYARTRQTPVIPDAPYGGRDVLDFLNDNTIALPPDVLAYVNEKKGAKLNKQGRGGDYDFLEKYSVPKAFRKYLFSEGATGNINEVAQMAHDEGLISDPTPDALMAAVLEQIDARESYTRAVDAREKQLAEEEKALIAREKAEAKRQNTWADDVINGSMETPFIGIDPKLMAAYTIKGAQLIREGFTTFAKWSAEMLSRFGNAVKDYLQGAWQAAVKNSQAGGSLPNGEKPGTGNQEPGTAPEIKLTHAAERQRMEAEGKAPLPTGGQGTVEEWQQEAAARVQQPGAATALVTDILNQQRPATPMEHYMLTNYAAALDAQLDEANAALADPAATPDDRAAAAAQRGTLDAERDRVAVAQQIAGSKAGAALGARARGIERGVVPSLSKMVADISIIQDPTGRTPLPPEERAVIEQTHAKMVEAEAAAQQHEAQGSQTDLHTELQKLLEEAQQQIAAQKTQLEAQEHALNVQPGKLRIYTKSKVKLKEWSDDGRAAREELLKMIGVQVNASFGIEMLPQVARMVRGFMADGFLTADAVAKKLVKAVPPEFYNSLKNFLPQIMDAADKLGREDAKIQTPDDIKAKARKQVLANDGGLPRSTARQIALAHITDHLVRGDKTLSAAKIAKLVQQDLEEFQPGITEREARDLISGYGQSSFPSKDEARATLRDLAAQMQKLTQLEALKNRERLLKSGPQRDKASAELRELQKQVEDLKKDIGYKGTTREDELKSIRDRIQTHLENQIEELQRVIAGKARPTGPREAVIYDQELQRLKELRDTLREQVAEMPEHKLATEERRNKAAMKSAQKSEAEWNRRAKAMQWKKPGKPPAAFTAEVEAARAKAKEARANFEALKKTADPRNDPEVRTLRDFKRRTQLQIDAINDRIAKGDFEPKKRTPRQVKHDAESDKLRHALAQRKRDWIDLKLQHKYQMMGLPKKGLEVLRKVYNTSRAIMTGGEFSGILRQGFFKLVSRPGRVLAGDIPAMLRAFRSEQGEFSLLNSLQMRPNGITGRYKEAKLALHNPHDYSSMIAEGNYRTAWANKIPFIAGTGRAYTALLAHMRADLFDMMTEKLEAANNSQPLTTRELEAIGEFVNDSTGAGKLGFGNNQIRSGEAKELLGAAIFSPAFVASRFRLLFGASLWGGTLRTRQAIAGEYLRMAAGTAAVYALLSALADRDDDRDRFDPRSSNLLKLKFGETKLDIMAGLNQAAVLLAREWMGQITRKGKTTPIRGEGVPFGGTTATDVAVNFLRSKASPAASFAWNRLSGTDYSGNPATLKHDLLQFTLPITGGSIADIVRTEPPRRAIPLSAAAYFGFGTQTRTTEDAARRR